MILSDASIREELAAGRIVIEPLNQIDVQPSSVDLRVDRYFRVFRNDTTPYIDPKLPQEDLTELVEIAEDRAFILHPGEFVLGSTLEWVELPNHLVARLEGKSSLGRLGLLIHSSLPGSEPIVVAHDGRVEVLPIATVVRKSIQGSVVGFDPDTLEARYFPITGWYEGPPDRIYEVRLASGRSVRVTAGHNLFSLDPDGGVVKLRTCQLTPGTRVAIPRRLPDAELPAPVIDFRRLVPEQDHHWLVVEGPRVTAGLEDPGVLDLLREQGYGHVGFYRARSMLPYAVAALVPNLLDQMTAEDRVRGKGVVRGLPIQIPVDPELAWFLGLYVAEGYRRRTQVVISNTDCAILDRAEAVLSRLGFPVYRKEGTAITCSSRVLSAMLGWLGTGSGAHTKRLPDGVLGWPEELLSSLLEGLMDGDGSRHPVRDSYWSCSRSLVNDVLLLSARLGKRAAAYHRRRGARESFQVAFPNNEHKLLLSVPLPDRLLVRIRRELGLAQNRASRLAGFRNATDLNNIERRRGRTALRRSTLRRIRDGYSAAGAAPSAPLLDRLVDGDVAWDTILGVVDTGVAEPIFDIEVRPGGRPVENFVAGSGGVFVSNTAGFVDAGFKGHLTLELSNVANLPIAIYPGMKIGQISFIQMTSAADRPYGSEATGSKYQGQRGPTPSRYYLNFEGRRAER